MPWARVLVLEEERDGAGGAMLYRYGGDDLHEFAGDTWSESVEGAKRQAEFEYEELLGEWEPIPREIDDSVEYAIGRVRGLPQRPLDQRRS
jgi:hypothetical protein